jgi:hypothetical protein
MLTILKGREMQEDAWGSGVLYETVAQFRLSALKKSAMCASNVPPLQPAGVTQSLTCKGVTAQSPSRRLSQPIRHHGPTWSVAKIKLIIPLTLYNQFLQTTYSMHRDTEEETQDHPHRHQNGWAGHKVLGDDIVATGESPH